jgi:diguanylate cyclase (GGDEF)-like protein
MLNNLRREHIQAKLAIGLLLVTLGALFVQHWFKRTWVLDATTTIPYAAVDDRSNGNGASIARAEVSNTTIVLHCEIIESEFPWPYCEIKFDLRQSLVDGMDLSNFSSVQVWAKYITPTPVGIRMQIRNFDKQYSRADDESTLKYNSVELFESNADYPASFPMQAFQVVSWWLTDMQIPIKHSGPDFSNSHILEIATGNYIKPGKHTLAIEKIVLQGKYISDQLLYLLLIALWSVAALVHLIMTIFHIRRALSDAANRQQELEALNNLLNVKHQKMEQKINRDALTGVLNRYGMDSLFELNNSTPQRLNLSIIFIDIDFFKRVNDNYGHHVGDDVLVNFAQLISQNIRESDVFARWGGEEFILASPNTNLSCAAQLAEKLRACIERHSWPENIPVTASFGVAEMHNESPSDFIARADKALYEAKSSGRNKVCIAHQKG